MNSKKNNHISSEQQDIFVHQGNYLAKVIHDIQNNLMVVNLSSDMLLDDHLSNKDKKEIIDNIKDSCTGSQQVLDNLSSLRHIFTCKSRLDMCTTTINAIIYPILEELSLQNPHLNIQINKKNYSEESNIDFKIKVDYFYTQLVFKSLFGVIKWFNKTSKSINFTTELNNQMVSVVIQIKGALEPSSVKWELLSDFEKCLEWESTNHKHHLIELYMAKHIQKIQEGSLDFKHDTKGLEIILNFQPN